MDILVYIHPIYMCVFVSPKSVFKFFALLSFQVYFGMLDALLASEEFPEEYRDGC
jgi:hypothetical protein